MASFCPENAFLEGMEGEVTDPSVKRPKAPPKKRGTEFLPLDIGPDFPLSIHLPADVLPSNALGLFALYFTQERLELIVDYTNRNYRPSKDPDLPYTRAEAWIPLTTQELMIYLGITIYMGLHEENRIRDYWNTSPTTPYHPIALYMSLNRFEAIKVRFSLSNPDGDRNIWKRVGWLNSLLF